MQGPVVTQVIVEDRSPSRSFDFGWTCTANCSGDYARPVGKRCQQPLAASHFCADLLSEFPQVKIDFILEND